MSYLKSVLLYIVLISSIGYSQSYESIYDGNFLDTVKTKVMEGLRYTFYSDSTFVTSRIDVFDKSYIEFGHLKADMIGSYSLSKDSIFLYPNLSQEYTLDSFEIKLTFNKHNSEELSLLGQIALYDNQIGFNVLRALEIDDFIFLPNEVDKFQMIFEKNVSKIRFIIPSISNHIFEIEVTPNLESILFTGNVFKLAPYSSESSYLISEIFN